MTDNSPNGAIVEFMKAMRPDLEYAAKVIQEAITKLPGTEMIPTHFGPEYWSWTDQSGKVFSVAPSPEHDGHPTLTIRQPIVRELGVWITTTALLLGPDRSSIINSVTMAVVNHGGAFAGFESVVKTVAEQGTAMAGLDRAAEIAGKDKAVVAAVAKSIRERDDDSGGMN